MSSRASDIWLPYCPACHCHQNTQLCPASISGRRTILSQARADDHTAQASGWLIFVALQRRRMEKEE